MEMMMQTVTATEFQNKVGQYLDLSRLEPIEIRKNGRRTNVILSAKEYDILQAREDAYWGELAMDAIKRNDFLSHEESMRWLIENMDDETRAKTAASFK